MVRGMARRGHAPYCKSNTYTKNRGEKKKEGAGKNSPIGIAQQINE